MPDWNRLQAGQFLVLGRAGMDLYPDPPGTPTAEASRFVSDLGGSAGNIAAALVRAGSAASLVSAVSNDAVGRFVLAALARHGIGTVHVAVRGGGVRTSLALAESRMEGHETVIYRNGAADFALDRADVVALPFAPAAALVVTGTALAADPSRSATRAAMAAARAAGLPVILDLDYRPYSWADGGQAQGIMLEAAAAADMIVGNDEEFGVLAGSPAAGRDLARGMGRDGRIAVYKMGAAGSVTFTDGAVIETPVFPVTPLKPFGAGDAFLGNLLAALAGGQPLDTALRRGSAAAAMVVATVGCAGAMPTPDTLDTFIARYPAPQRS
ncbi:MAG: permease [Limimaricola sp.]|uniref:PfkB family carbohydrate kinase n=1 Tax=Limimaricola sp. TaxID=2211665 RepID=UPI001D7E9751|nr:PfkB family carbohydrate kinase [Limimaricola sp.]MBI1416474.1 permease [Limimaricola sp.]